MDKITSIYNDLLISYTLPGLLLMVAIAGLLAVQLYYYLGPYARIPGFRNMKAGKGDTPPPAVSVVVVVRDELHYINDILPKLLAQQYTQFEVVVVNLGNEAETADALTVMSQIHPHLHVTRLIQQEQRFPITNKMALNVGIKAAAYSHLLLTTTEACPASTKWLSLMSKGFYKGEIVIGYCGIEPAKGIANRLMRAGRLNMSVRYLSAAIKGKPYRGISHNIGYSAELYFSAKGFDHLDLEAGDDDLFLQRIARSSNTSVVMNPSATMRQRVWGGAADWFTRQVKYRSTWRYYPQAAKNYIEWETWSRALFFAACATACICMPFEIAIAAGALLFARLFIVEFQIWRICRRLGERGLLWTYIIYDIFSPLYALGLWGACKVRSRRNEWK